MNPPSEGIPLSEVIAALSSALDITEGQPEGHAVRSCLIGMRVAREIGLGADESSHLFYAILLKDLGCSSNAARTCALFGADDLEVKRSWKTTDWSSGWRAFLHVAHNVEPGASPLARARRVLAFATAGAVGNELVQTRCERGADIARMLELAEPTAEAIRGLDEHWDGSGKPAGLRGADIPLLARIASLAQTVDVFLTAFGRDAALEVARERSGRWFDPTLVRALECTRGDALFWERLHEPDLRAAVAAVEPADRILVADEDRLDRIAEGFARVIDAKSPYTFRHSEGVAEYAVGAARVLGFDPRELRELRRTALLHDIGKLGVSNLILDKPGRLTDEEMAVVRLHPEYTERILGRVSRFRYLAWIAGAHHERMDGRGYHRGIPAGTLPVAARVLAVADVCEALSAVRPYRPALPREEVVRIMRAMVPTGLCPESFAALESSLPPDRLPSSSPPATPDGISG
jgi:HD-GYP domain-containing protein (c-di-GMP phosphodiesterase class II)